MTKLLFIVICVFMLQQASACKDAISTATCEYYRDYSQCKFSEFVQKNCKKTCNLCVTTGKPVTATNVFTTRKGVTTAKPLTTTNVPTTQKGHPSCKDKTYNCQTFKKRGLCIQEWVKRICQLTCDLCGVTTPFVRSTQVRVTYTVDPYTPKPGSCGISSVPVSRVIAGKFSKDGQWPWQVAMLKRDRFNCGGSLITPEWVVTAAHCVKKLSAADIKVVLGELDRGQISGNEQTIAVKHVITHSNYGKPQLNNDIALLKLTSPVKLNGHVRTVCLPRQDEKVSVGARCYISGWGKTSHPGFSVLNLRHASLEVISNKDCSSSNSLYGQITDQMVCAANKAPYKQSGCHGDSGGPFVCQQTDGSWILHGAVSWGSPQCNVNDAKPVFARISAFRKWIDEQLLKFKTS